MVSPTMPPTRFDRGTRRIALCGLTTVSALVLLFSYRTSTSAEVPADAGAADTPDAGAGVAVASGSAAPETGDGYGGGAGDGGSEAGAVDPRVAAAAAGPAPGSASTGRAWSGSVTGPVVHVKWGEVQVRATIAEGRITAVDVLRTPDENARDLQVNARAVPVLVRETLEAQSTRIDMVSGATYTSDGYVQSLQAALDRAGTT
jgi:uncharacterized protein with FMN-binding domain